MASDFLELRRSGLGIAAGAGRIAARLALLASLLGWALGGAQAHDGPHMAPVLADVLSVQTEGRDVHVALRLEALQESVTFVAATARFAETMAPVPQVLLTTGEPVGQTVHLRFDDDVPDLFTLTLDFGEAGVAAVPVVTP